MPLTRVLRYLVISPVKDEEKYVEYTLDSMVRQTLKPVRWIIVDDGSTDRTPQILERYRASNNFVEVVQAPCGKNRQPGPAVIRAFNQGYEAGRHLPHDVVVKLDCDLSFGPEYFETLMAAFSTEPKLGICSGIYQEAMGGSKWVDIRMPPYHAAGATKAIRRRCFDEIGGFISARGWDTVDEIRAMTRGWRTCHFPELKLRHWKPEGSGIGWRRTRMMHGEVYYLTGGGGFFFVLKLFHCLKAPPMFLGALSMLWGYLHAAFQRRPRLVNLAELQYYRALLNRRIAGKIRGLLQSDQS